MNRVASSIVAATALCLALPAAAQQQVAPATPPKAEQPKVGGDAKLAPAELPVQLAELAERAEPPKPAPAVKRARVARVSSCRCGDLSSQQ